MIQQPEIWQILLANAIVALGAFIQSGAGFGLGLLAVPLLTLINPVFTPGAFLFSSLFQNMVMVKRNYTGIRRDWLAIIFPWVIAGSVFAYLALRKLSGPGTELAIGCTILLAVAISASGFTVKPTRKTLAAGGAIAGIMSTVGGVPGPPLILLLQNEEGVEIRANLAIAFLFSSAASLVAFHMYGTFGSLHIMLGLSLLPGIFTGAALGTRFASFLDGRCLRPVLLSLVAFGGAALVVRNIL